MIMSIIGMILLGLLVGWVAKTVVPGSAHLGWVQTGLLGIAGGWVGGTLGSLVFSPHEFEITRTRPSQVIFTGIAGALVGGFLLSFFVDTAAGGWWFTLFTAVLGSVILLWILGKVRK